MRISTVKEIKTQEARCGITPAGVTVLVQDGHDVFVERGAGMVAGFDDDQYEQAALALGVNTRAGAITHADVANAFPDLALAA